MARKNGFANFAGVVGGLSGFLVQHTGNFSNAVRHHLSAVALVGGLAFVFIVGPVEPVSWTRNHDPAIAPLSPKPRKCLCMPAFRRVFNSGFKPPQSPL